MKASKTGLGLFAAMIAIFALPTAVQAEYLVPPGNSAATQYTEAVPTAGGPKATDQPKHGKGQSPSQVLGGKNAQKLNQQGPEGRAAAEVAAETAPGAVAQTGGGGAPATTPGHAGAQPQTNGGNSGGEKGQQAGGTPSGNGSGRQTATTAILASQQLPDGSSGFGEVLGQATGSSDSGQLGLLLPLIVLATIAWSVAYVVRRRKQPTQ
jgi:hypothetical protein